MFLALLVGRRVERLVGMVWWKYPVVFVCPFWLFGLDLVGFGCVVRSTRLAHTISLAMDDDFLFYPRLDFGYVAWQA